MKSGKEKSRNKIFFFFFHEVFDIFDTVTGRVTATVCFENFIYDDQSFKFNNANMCSNWNIS